MQGRAGIAARNELAVHEERVGRAPDEMVSGRMRLDQYPGVGNRPLQQLCGACSVGDRDAGETDVFARTVALDHERAGVTDLDHAHHFAVSGHGRRKKENQGENLHFAYRVAAAETLAGRAKTRNRWGSRD